jgi:hypothetical protein
VLAILNNLEYKPLSKNIFVKEQASTRARTKKEKIKIKGFSM